MTPIAITKKTWLARGALALFPLVLVMGTNAVLRWLPATPEEDNRGSVLPPPNEDASQAPPNGGTRIIETAPHDPRAVTYTDAGFSTRSITIRADDPLGCAMTIRNETAKTITIRVGPHNANGEDPGFPYQPIAPKETSILDVRYAGLSSITIHDHARPQFELTVHYGEGCR